MPLVNRSDQLGIEMTSASGFFRVSIEFSISDEADGPSPRGYQLSRFLHEPFELLVANTGTRLDPGEERQLTRPIREEASAPAIVFELFASTIIELRSRVAHLELIVQEALPFVLTTERDPPKGVGPHYELEQEFHLGPVVRPFQLLYEPAIGGIARNGAWACEEEAYAGLFLEIVEHMLT